MQSLQLIKQSIFTVHKRLYATNRYYGLHLFMVVLIALCLGFLIKQITLKSDSEVRLSIKCKAAQNDNFQLFYRPLTDSTDREVHSIRREIKGSGAFQLITFSLPDTLKIKNLRLDLGDTYKVKTIDLEYILLSYNNSNLQLFNSASDLGYFTTNEFIKQTDHEHFIYMNKAKFDPFLYSKEMSSDYLQLLSSKKTIPYPFLISFIVLLSLYAYSLLYRKQSSFMNKFYGFASCFFMLLLLLPFFNDSLGWYKDESQEKRTLAKRPQLDSGNVLDYPKNFEKYYNDNFSFKNLLVNLGGKIKYYCFNSSAVSDKLSVGKNGWLFLNGSFYWITKDLNRENLYTPAELKATVAEWERRVAFMKKDSICFYKAMWPDKHYIYPEFLPYNMKVIMKDTLSRCDQAVNYLKAIKSDFKIVDVRPALGLAKRGRLIYQKYDSHWNAYGAFVAYTELLNCLSVDYPTLKPLPETAFDIKWEEQEAGDLAEIIGIKVTENKPVFTLKTKRVNSKKIPTDGFPAQTLIYENTGAATNLTALIFRDSFTNEMIRFLNLHFAKVVLIWNTPYSDDLVNKVHPDLVIEAYASRYF